MRGPDVWQKRSFLSWKFREWNQMRRKLSSEKYVHKTLGEEYDDFILLAHRDWSSQDFLPWLLLRAPLICKRFLPQAFFNLIGIHKPDPSMIALKTNLTCEASRWVVTSTAHFPWWGSREIDPLDLEN